MGANGQCPGGAYCSTRHGAPSGNGNGNGKAVGKPCAGCVGKADNKNPHGQRPNGSDHNAGYECDRNHGIGRTNPAHTGCTPSTPGSGCVATPTHPCTPGGSGCVATATHSCTPGGSGCVATATHPCTPGTGCVATATQVLYAVTPPCTSGTGCVATASHPCTSGTGCVATASHPCTPGTGCVATATQVLYAVTSPCTPGTGCVATATHPCFLDTGSCVATGTGTCAPAREVGTHTTTSVQRGQLVAPVPSALASTGSDIGTVLLYAIALLVAGSAAAAGGSSALRRRR